ncbi:MAG TPA: DUF5009 domain-containing protein [Verrucomicrobiae bacterium]
MTTTDAPQMPAMDKPPRIVSIDALRGFVMFTMIFVNDLAGVSEKVVPPWMRHFHGKSGMTFVDMVFPGFLFIVGMSIPFALGGRLSRGEPAWKMLLHVLARTAGLLAIGILMVNDESPGQEMSGLAPNLWAVLMYLSAMLAFCSISFRMASTEQLRIPNLALRIVGIAGMVTLAFMFRGEKGGRIISLSPFEIHTVWYGILGLIGWAYLVGSIVFLLFRTNSTALLGCCALLLAMYPAERTGVLDGLWLGRYVGLGGTLGSQPSITVAGVLLASMLFPPGRIKLAGRLRFAGLFILGCSAAALLLAGLYGINKNAATPSWCLWACVITAALWVIFHALCDLGTVHPIGKILAIAGENVLLAYLISEMLPSLLDLLHLDSIYDNLASHGLASGIARSAGCGVVILCVTAGLNRAGFRLRL